MSCTKVGDFCKRPAEVYPLRIPLSGSFFIRTFLAGEILAAGDFRRPKKANGFEYEVTAGGQCESEPDWPTTLGETVTTGSVTFTCRAISNASLARVISSVVWIGGTLTIGNDGIVNTNGELEVFAQASGGNTGDTGEVVARITFGDGTIEEASLDYHVD